MRRRTAKLTVELKKKKKPFERTHIDGSLHLPATKLPRRQMRKSERIVEESEVEGCETTFLLHSRGECSTQRDARGTHRG